MIELMTRDQIDIEVAKAFAGIELLRAGTAKLQAEAGKIQAETRFYPWIMGISAITALGTLATIANKVL